MRTTRQAALVALAVALLAGRASPGFSQSVVAGTAKKALGMLVVVKSDGVEARLQGRGALRVFDGDVLRIEGKGQALIETEEAIQVALNGNAVVKILSRWEKGQDMTRILRVQQGEVWVRSNDAQRAVEVETPVGVLAARAAEVSVRLVSPDEAAVTVVKGTAEFSTPGSSCQLRAGTMSLGSRGKACTLPTVTDVRSITGWSHPLLTP